MTTSPTFTSSATRPSPSSFHRPGPAATTVPSWGFSLAVSGITRPDAVGKGDAPEQKRVPERVAREPHAEQVRGALLVPYEAHEDRAEQDRERPPDQQHKRDVGRLPREERHPSGKERPAQRQQAG